MIDTKLDLDKETETKNARASGKPVIVPTSKQPAHEEIAALAYEFWIQRGSPHGSHEEDWHSAEQLLRGKTLSKAAGA